MDAEKCDKMVSTPIGNPQPKRNSGFGSTSGVSGSLLHTHCSDSLHIGCFG